LRAAVLTSEPATKVGVEAGAEEVVEEVVGATVEVGLGEERVTRVQALEMSTERESVKAVSRKIEKLTHGERFSRASLDSTN
jgi:hypothetical protein